MRIFGRRKAGTLLKRKLKDLRNDRRGLEVSYDQATMRMKRAQEQWNGYLAAATREGLSDAELDIAAYQMEVAEKRKGRSEAEIQNFIVELQATDYLIELRQEKDASKKKKDTWAEVAKIKPEDRDAELREVAIGAKERKEVIRDIAGMGDLPVLQPDANQSSVFRANREKIDQARKEKLGH